MRRMCDHVCERIIHGRNSHKMCQCENNPSVSKRITGENKNARTALGEKVTVTKFLHENKNTCTTLGEKMNIHKIPK